MRGFDIRAHDDPPDGVAFVLNGHEAILRPGKTRVLRAFFRDEPQSFHIGDDACACASPRGLFVYHRAQTAFVRGAREVYPGTGNDTHVQTKDLLERGDHRA